MVGSSSHTITGSSSNSNKGIGTRNRFQRANRQSKEKTMNDDNSDIISNIKSDNNSIAERHSYGEVISALSNFSIQYNLGVIAPALLLLDHTRVSHDSDLIDENPALYPRTDDADSLLKSAVFIGAIVGQCSMGFIGDALFGSLHMAMLFTNCLSLLGTLGSVFAPLLGRCEYYNAARVYNFLAIFRLIIGIGVGGKYPLGSAIRAQAAESDTEHPDRKDHRAKEVAKGFFWQTPGAISPYLVQLVLLMLIGDEYRGLGRKFKSKTIQQYIILVGMGAIPSIAMIWFSFLELSQKSPSSSKNADAPGNLWNLCIDIVRKHKANRRSYSTVGEQENNSKENNKLLNEALRNKEYWGKLLGTGLSWSLYDFVYYGTAFNQPEMLATVLGDSEKLMGVSWRDAMVAMMGIPGVILAIRMMEKPLGGPKPLQAWGFVAIAAACFLLLGFYSCGDYIGPVLSKWGGFLSCAILICALNWGCNVSTYVLPMEVYPKEVRSSFHGISAGMGKVGALCGSVIFTHLNRISISLTFLSCILSCCFGILITWRFVEPKYQNTFFIGKGVESEEESNILLDKQPQTTICLNATMEDSV